MSIRKGCQVRPHEWALCSCAWITVLGILSGVLGSSIAMAQTNAKNVLVVFSSRQSDLRRDLDLLESSVRARVPGQVNFAAAYLDYRLSEEKPYWDSLAETFRREYVDVKPDVLIAASIQSLRFAMQYRAKLFPGVPIVFFGVSTSELEGTHLLPGITGVTASLGLRETIDLALRLHPDTKAVAIIADTPGSTEKHWVALTHSELLRHQDKVKEIDVIGPPSREMLERIAALPRHTVALFELAPASSAEPAVGAFDVLDATAQYLPTYSPYHTICLNHGCVGGAYYDSEKNTVLAGNMAARILLGEQPEDIPVVDKSIFKVQVDWRALQRWHIPEAALPTGSVILYRPPTLWEQYRKYLNASIVLIAVLGLLIVGMLWQRARRRKAEAVMRESEKRFRVMADSTPSLVWMCDSHGKVTYLNERRIAFTGPDPKAGYGDNWIAYIHPDDVQSVLDALFKALKDRQPFSKEYRLRRRDGVYRRMFDVASPRLNGDGSFAGFIGSAIDVTDQKLAQEALEKVSGQLIEAQEKERSRIARDLHDDICQRLALLSMEIEQANRNQSGSPRNLEEIRKHCSEIAGDVQSLSHQLHSSKLDYLGVVAAVRGFCSEFSKQHKVSIEFTDSNVPGNLPKDISLCLFRVAQEALHNAVKYSGVSRFSVEINGMANEIQLAVRDAGAGFDVEEAKKNRGLGLVSMQERIHLARGKFSIESHPGKGTTILAVMPLVVENGESSEDWALKETSSVPRMV